MTVGAHDTAAGYTFVASKNGPGEDGIGQDGPCVLDDSGHVVWFRPTQGARVRPIDFKVQRFGGRPVLSWWEGTHIGDGRGEYVILDDSYREITRVRTGNGYQGDRHEFLMTPQDTALITIYYPVRRDLSRVGGPRTGVVWQGIVQELAFETGEVIFEWRSLDHVGLDETYVKVSNDAPPPSTTSTCRTVRCGEGQTPFWSSSRHYRARQTVNLSVADPTQMEAEAL